MRIETLFFALIAITLTFGIASQLYTENSEDYGISDTINNFSGYPKDLTNDSQSVVDVESGIYTGEDPGSNSDDSRIETGAFKSAGQLRDARPGLKRVLEQVVDDFPMPPLLVKAAIMAMGLAIASGLIYLGLRIRSW